MRKGNPARRTGATMMGRKIDFTNWTDAQLQHAWDNTERREDGVITERAAKLADAIREEQRVRRERALADRLAAAGDDIDALKAIWLETGATQAFDRLARLRAQAKKAERRAKVEAAHAEAAAQFTGRVILDAEVTVANDYLLVSPAQIDADLIRAFNDAHQPVYTVGPFSVVRDEDDSFYYVHDARTGERVSNPYPLAKTANRRARQLAEAETAQDEDGASELHSPSQGEPGCREPSQDPENPAQEAPEAPVATTPAAEVQEAAQSPDFAASEAYREHVKAFAILVEEVLADAKPKAATREQWLLLASELIRPLLKERAGLELHSYRVTCGWPSKGGRGSRKRVLGEAWHHTASSDGTAEVFITPLEDDPRRVLAILAHELIHTCLPAGTGHGAPFVAAARTLGFAAPFTQLNPTDELWAWADKIIAALPAYPHARILDGQAEGAPKKQGTRMIKATCERETPEGELCGYTVRLTRKWIDEVGPPICPRCREPMVCEGLAGGDPVPQDRENEEESE